MSFEEYLETQEHITWEDYVSLGVEQEWLTERRYEEYMYENFYCE